MLQQLRLRDPRSPLNIGEVCVHARNYHTDKSMPSGIMIDVAGRSRPTSRAVTPVQTTERTSGVGMYTTIVSSRNIRAGWDCQRDKLTRYEG